MFTWINKTATRPRLFNRRIYLYGITNQEGVKTMAKRGTGKSRITDTVMTSAGRIADEVEKAGEVILSEVRDGLGNVRNTLMGAAEKAADSVSHS